MSGEYYNLRVVEKDTGHVLLRRHVTGPEPLVGDTLVLDEIPSVTGGERKTVRCKVESRELMVDFYKDLESAKAVLRVMVTVL